MGQEVMGLLVGGTVLRVFVVQDNEKTVRGDTERCVVRDDVRDHRLVVLGTDGDLEPSLLFSC